MPLLRPASNGEHVPRPAGPVVEEAARRALERAEEAARRQRMDRRAFLRSSAGVAGTLLALSACSDDSGGGDAGRYDVPGDAADDPEVADDALGPSTTAPEEPPEVVVDVQTHFLEGDDHGFGRGFPQARCGTGDCLGIETWADLVFGASDTSVAVLSAIPVVADDGPMSIAKMEQARRLAEQLCGDRRVLLQGEAFPQVGELGAALDRMAVLAEEHDLVAWKTYTHVGPRGGYRFDDPVGTAFLDHVEALAAAGLGPRVVCVHKGLGADPADVGPAAAAHPDLTFCVYHSGYESWFREGPFAEDGQGVDRFVRSLRDAGIAPGGNVYAELGTTWRSVLGDPDAAAHVLGKLLLAVGPERILWGTDSIWYGSPQDQIQAFRAFTIADAAQERFGYPPLTPEVKRRILGRNAAELHVLVLAALPPPCTPGERADAIGRLAPLGLADGPTGPVTRREVLAAWRQAHPWFAA